VKKKPISEAERRETAEQKAQQKRAQAEAKRQEAENKAAERSEKVFQGMWQQFSDDITTGKAFAYNRLLLNLTKFSTDLVPRYYTAKEYQAAIAEAADYSKSDGKQSAEDPRTLISNWLRGTDDLSRIKLDKAAA
jgi:hypothetical protein